MSRISAALFLLILPAVMRAGTIVSAVTPPPFAMSVDCSTLVHIAFTGPMRAGTLSDTTIVISSLYQPLRRALITYDSLTHAATLRPLQPFRPGEHVRVSVTTAVRSADTSAPAEAYSWEFTTAVSATDTALFVQTSQLKTGAYPWGIVAGDFDGDGMPELAVLNSGTRSVSIFENDGKGYFALSSTVTVDPDPSSLAAADLNGDGALDLAVINSRNATLSLLMNDGHGLFTARPPVEMGNYPWSVIAADFDGDGKIDLATGGDSVAIWRNDGDATFTHIASYDSGINPLWLAAADVDNNGTIDIAASNYISNSVSIFKNNGKGVFTKSGEVAVGGYPYTLAQGDYDGNGSVDFAVVSGSYPGTVSILQNDGTGSFTHSFTAVVGKDPLSIAPADLDGNGIVDLAVANWTSNSVSMLINDGRGHFAQQSTAPTGASPRALAAADFDGDGDIDLAVADQDSSSVTILKKMNVTFIRRIEPAPNAPAIALDTAITVRFGTPIDAASLSDSTLRVFGSLSGMHRGTVTYAPASKSALYSSQTPFAPGEHLQVIATTRIRDVFSDTMYAPYAWEYTARAAPAPAQFLTLPADTVHAGAQSVVAADLNRDGIPDLVLGGDSVAVMMGNGSGGFTRHPLPLAENGPYAVAAGDIDADGDVDVTVAPIYSGTVRVFTNDGTGRFSSSALLFPATAFSVITLADVNGDGNLDILLGGSAQNGFNPLIVQVIYSHAGGILTPGTPLTTSVDQPPPTAIVTGDFDGDGKVDIAITSRDGTIYLLKSNGDWTRTAPRPLFGASASLAAGDFDGDGHLDIAMTAVHGLEIYHNDGTGTLTPALLPNVDIIGNALVAADFDGDGDLDLALTRADSASALLYTNDGAGTFSRSTIPRDTTGAGLAAADLDGDGSLDLAVAEANGLVAPLLNRTTPASIQLVRLTASALQDSTIRIQWTTARETANKGFYVLRREEHEQLFAEVPGSFVPGHGTTLERQQYLFIDSTAGPGTWFYRLRQEDLSGTSHLTEAVRAEGVTSVREGVPLVFSLAQNFPNPFNPETEIRFSVDASAPTTLVVYTMLGQRAATLFDGLAVPGREYRLRFNGQRLATGMYIYRLTSGAHVATKKLLLLR